MHAPRPLPAPPEAALGHSASLTHQVRAFLDGQFELLSLTRWDIYACSVFYIRVSTYITQRINRFLESSKIGPKARLISASSRKRSRHGATRHGRVGRLGAGRGLGRD